MKTRLRTVLRTVLQSLRLSVFALLYLVFISMNIRPSSDERKKEEAIVAAAVVVATLFRYLVATLFSYKCSVGVVNELVSKCRPFASTS